MKLAQLLKNYPDANSVWIRDDGNGAGLAKNGEMVWVTDFPPANYNVIFVEVNQDTWISEWVYPEGANEGYRYQMAMADNSPWLSPATLLGSLITEKTQAASRANGKKGGRPKKQTK